MTSRLFILAGEASGDVLAAQLMHAVGKVKGPVAWSGIGGPHICLLYTSDAADD